MSKSIDFHECHNAMQTKTRSGFACERKASVEKEKGTKDIVHEKLKADNESRQQIKIKRQAKKG